MCRVSSDDQVKGYSLDDQYERLVEYCRKNGYIIVYEFKEDHSAKSFNRPEWKKMMQLIKQGKLEVDELLFISWDRFSRNMVEGLQMVETLLQVHNIEPQAIQQPIDYSVPESKYLLAIYLASPNVDNDNRSYHTKKGIHRGLMQGRWPRPAFYGYQTAKHEDEKSMIIPHPTQAPVVKEIFERVANGEAQTEILKDLKAREIKMSRNNLCKIIKRINYAGKIIVPAYRGEPMKIVQGIHEPLVSEALFYKVQNLLSENRKARGKYEPKYAKLRDDFHLRGVVNCKSCGHMLTSSLSRGKLGKRYGYYHCHRCKGQTVSQEKMHKAFENLLNSIQIEPELVTLYNRILADQKGYSEKNNKAKVSKLNQKLKDIDKRLIKSQDLMLDGKLDPDEYVSIKARYMVEQNAIKDQISSLRASMDDFLNMTKAGINLLSNIVETYRKRSIRMKHKIVGSIFLENLVFDGNKFRTPKLNKIFDLFASIERGLQGNEKGITELNFQLSPTAENEGFEPPVPYGTIVFKTTAFDHSANSP